MEALVGLIGLNAVLLLLLVWLTARYVRTGRAAVAGQLLDMKVQLEALADLRADLPRLLSDARADQVSDVSRQLASFAQVVSGHIEAGHETVGRRLADAGELISDVRERLGQLTVSTRRIEELGAGVNEVHQLLRVPKLRGTVGELWLEEMLQQIVPADMYEKQYRFPSGERVDAVIRLNGRLLCVDAKFPLDACQRMLATNSDTEESERHRRVFLRSVRARVDEVARKYVRPDDGTFDFALMYVPAERVFHEALAGDPEDVMVYALDRHVVMVSPNTLYAYLSAIVHGLRGLHVQRNARQVADIIGGLRSTLSQLIKVHETVARHLDGAARHHAESCRLVRNLDTQLAGIPGLLPVTSRFSRPFVAPVAKDEDR